MLRKKRVRPVVDQTVVPLKTFRALGNTGLYRPASRLDVMRHKTFACHTPTGTLALVYAGVPRHG